MKVLDYLLIVVIVAFLVASYLTGSAEGKAGWNLLAVFCAAWFGSRIGGRTYKKNHEN
ncbi:MAG: hypothetical protein J5543_08680 [Bacteroidales bacterium]|jgi:uncharacterized membrane protein required for colicin V production|nr:hypothetical protein [Bacteroidales bacterium]